MTSFASVIYLMILMVSLITCYLTYGDDGEPSPVSRHHGVTTVSDQVFSDHIIEYLYLN